jgi:hypothetical protein
MLGAATVAVPGTTAAPATAAGSTGGVISAREQRQALNYWTPTRMRRAKAYPTPKVGGRPRLTADADVVGRMRRFEASDPHESSQNRATRVVREAPLPAAYSYPYPFTRYNVESPLDTLSPYRMVGKLFFVQNGQSYVCSASSVVGNPRQIVFTAGHCIHDGGLISPGNPDDGWSTNIVFRPAYRSGASPNGYYVADSRWARSGWTDNGNFTEDMGAFSVGSPTVAGIGDGVGSLGGAPLRSRVGALGFIFNAGRNRHWDIFGYPAAPPFTGTLLVRCESNAAGFDENPEIGSGLDPTAVGCDQTGGSSGGPWILSLGTNNLLNGVISYKYTTQPLSLFGPYFSDNAQNLRCTAATGDTSATTC